MTQKISWWHPLQTSQRMPYLKQRQIVRKAIDKYFESQGFLAVETPALQVSPGLEPHLMAFKTQWEAPWRSQVQDFYLHTSPEFTMKKLLAGGLERIYQVAHCYRNRESSNTHSPEFSLLEWYRHGVDYRAIMADTEALLKTCRDDLRSSGWSGTCTWNGVSCDVGLEFERISVAQAFEKYVGLRILETINDTLNPSPHVLRQLALGIGVDARESDSWDDIFFKVFLDRIEPHLGIGRGTILYDYPLHMAALARAKGDDPRLAERFEVYVCGMELANAFSELTDEKIQRMRFEQDMQLKQKLYGLRYPIDEDFLRAVGELPPCAGIALGVDRLAMLFSGAKSIHQVMWAPVDVTLAE